jgi:3',5'-cyclic AMP phosphodiesterase CpdA
MRNVLSRKSVKIRLGCLVLGLCFLAWGTGFSAPLAQTTPRLFRAIVLSDLNGSYGDTTYAPEVSGAVDWILQRRPDLVLTTGDMIAGQQATLTDQRTREMWSSFHAIVTDRIVTVGIPFAVTPGNHDASGYSGFVRDRAIYAETWTNRIPKVELLEVSEFPFRYAFRLGEALFISLDATKTGPLDPTQKLWIRSLLQQYASAPVKILFGHMPLLPFAIGRQNDYLMDPAFEDELKIAGVSLYLSGHHHAYYPGRRDSLRLVGTSCLGGGARPLIGTLTPSPKTALEITWDSTGIRSIEAWLAPDFARRLERSTLPESLGSGALEIFRDDL